MGETFTSSAKAALGSDHGGFGLKERVKARLVERGLAVEDTGPGDRAAVDYPDYALRVAEKVADRSADFGVLVCTTGIGMAVAANKFAGIRAAQCLTPDMAEKARTHNDANILVLAERYTSPDEADAILDAWLAAAFTGEERHARRVAKMTLSDGGAETGPSLAETDPETHAAIEREIRRQRTSINLIASENTVSRAVREAQGSVLTNKYAEGYPGKRWYCGCENADVVERLAVERAKALFGAEHANVQPHCGSAANMAVYFAMLEPGDTILAMSLDHGGHLTHGSQASFSGRFFNFVSYGVDKDDERIDADAVERLAVEHRPRMIVAGASAYPRTIDFERFRRIADQVGALLLVDMAHIAGLVAADCHPNPVPFADFVTSTTHKTLRGARGGMVLCRETHAKAIDRQVFPGLQGGPLMHAIAAKAVTFAEAMKPTFKDYIRQVIRNAQAMAEAFRAEGLRLVSGGTDNHLMLVDLAALDMSGAAAAERLDRAGLIVNKNALPFDPRSMFATSGIRLGTPFMTSMGMKEAEAKTIAGMIVETLRGGDDEAELQAMRARVEGLAMRFRPEFEGAGPERLG